MKQNRVLQKLDFEITPKDYRKVQYFNTFAKSKKQPVFILTIWVLSLIGLILKFLYHIEFTKITFFCCLMVAVSVPFLIASLELTIYRYNHSSVSKQKRSLLCPDWCCCSR